MQNVLIYSGLEVMYTSHISTTRKLRNSFQERSKQLKTTAIHATGKSQLENE